MEELKRFIPDEDKGLLVALFRKSWALQPRGYSRDQQRPPEQSQW